MALVLVEGEDRLQALFDNSTISSSTTSGGSLPITVGKAVPLFTPVISFIALFFFV